MLNWVIITILILFALVALKINKLRHKFWIIFLILLVLFLYTSVSIVYDKYEIEVNSVEGVFHAARVYLGWLANSFQNLKMLTGNALRMDWTSTNASFFNKSGK